MHRIISTIVGAATAVTFVATLPAAAGMRHRRHATAVAAPAQAEALSRPSMFYPENVEGGSPGNLPFNNQIRKHTDPLNANGGR